MNILFVCSRNKRRSLTAETIFNNNSFHAFASAGTEESAKRKLTESMVIWADIIFVMEKRHRERIQEKFADAYASKNVVVLEIPDEYEYMDEELVEMLQDSVEPYLL